MPEKFFLAALRLPRDLPVSLPSQLVEQRPDVRAAEANLQSASAQIGVAIANRLPNITLTGNIGSTALAVDQLFTPGFGFWAATGAVTQPLFHGGALAAQGARGGSRLQSGGGAVSQHGASSRFRTSPTVCAPSKPMPWRCRRRWRRRRRRAAASKSPATACDLGDITYLAMLNAQQTYQQALLSLAQARAARFADTVALFQSLGGGWWNRSDVAPERPLSIGDVFQ